MDIVHWLQEVEKDWIGEQDVVDSADGEALSCQLRQVSLGVLSVPVGACKESAQQNQGNR